MSTVWKSLRNNTTFEPFHEIMVLFVLRKLILQTRMRSHPVVARCSIFGRTLRLLPYFLCANSEGSGETARMRMLAWAFVVRQCDKYHKSHKLAHLIIQCIILEEVTQPLSRQLIETFEKVSAVKWIDCSLVRQILLTDVIHCSVLLPSKRIKLKGLTDIEYHSWRVLYVLHTHRYRLLKFLLNKPGWAESKTSFLGESCDKTFRLEQTCAYVLQPTAEEV